VYYTKFGARKVAHYVEREIQRSIANRGMPVALPMPVDPGPQAPNAKPEGPVQRPLAGPVVPLTAMQAASEELIGSGRAAPAADAGKAAPPPPRPPQSLESATLPLLLPKLLSIEQVHGDCGGRKRPPASGAAQRGSVVDPIKNLSTACAAWRPSRIAHTTSD